MKIYPCFWMQEDPASALTLYRQAFPEIEVLSQSALVGMFRLHGFEVMLLNGGPQYRPNPAVSLTLHCDGEASAQRVWSALLNDAEVLMPLGTYDWSSCYGWLNDRNGISWQITTGAPQQQGQLVHSSLMFCGAQQGKANAAIDYYTGLFPRSARLQTHLYPVTMPELAGQVMYASFKLEDIGFAAMDSGVPQSFSFTPGNSHVIVCRDQDEIDYYWNAFTADGHESRCGWCDDKFGLSWQVIPASLPQLMSDPDTGSAVAQAMFRMKKLDLAELQRAAGK